jgi:[protein-PII] uridylyltransferase
LALPGSDQVSEPDSVPTGILVSTGSGFVAPLPSALARRVRLALADVDDGKAARAAAVREMQAARTEAVAENEAAFAADPRRARVLIQAQAHVTDALVEAAFAAAMTLHPVPNPTEAERIAVLGVGGYGRAEMAPQSDVDLLFLTPWKITPWAESVIETMLYMLWDLKLKVGHASRTVADCLRLGREDITIRTALLEHRFICGHAPWPWNLANGSGASCSKTPARNSSKPSCRNAPKDTSGRAASAMCWSRTSRKAKAVCATCRRCTGSANTCTGSPMPKVWSARAFSAARSLRASAQAEDFLWAVRCHLHYITKRPSDVLTFDLQVEVAARMGYRDLGGRRAVEIFMQEYFRHATRVGELTRVFLTELEARHAKREASLFGIFKLTKPVAKGYKLVQGRIDVADPKLFLKDKLNLLRVFEEGLRTGYPAAPQRHADRHLEPGPDRRRHARRPRSAAHLP